MNVIIKLAFLNLVRNYRRTLLTLFSIGTGLAVLLWLQCAIAARHKSVTESITSAFIGRIQVFDKNYWEDRLIQQSFQVPVDALKEGLPPEAQVTRRIYLPSLISSGEQSLPVVFTGLDPESERNVTLLPSRVVEGAFVDNDSSQDCQSRQIVIGRALAKLLKVDVGNKVVIFAQAADGSLGNDLFRVKGIFDTGSASFDKAYAFSSLNCVSKIGALSGVHEMTVGFPFWMGEKTVQDRLSKTLPPNLTVTTWRQVVPTIASTMRFNDAMFAMISVILLSVITMGIVNTLLMSVFERTREFGMMVALGTTPAQVRAVVLVESLFLGVGSALFGSAVGLAVVLYQSKYGFDLEYFLGSSQTVAGFKLDMVLYPVVDLLPFVSSVLVTLGAVFISALYPAFRASRLSPIEAMRYS